MMENTRDDLDEDLEMGNDILESKRKGMWYYINRKRKQGRKPAKPGEQGYPDEKTWKELTTESELLLREIVSEFLLEKKCKGYMKSPVGSPRQRSFCKRMCGMRSKNTGSETASDPDSCINQSLRRWHCRCSR